MSRKKYIGLKLVCFCRQYHSGDHLSSKKGFFCRCAIIVTLLLLLLLHYYYIWAGKCRRNQEYGNGPRKYRVVKHFNYHRRLMTYQRFLAMNYGAVDMGKPEYRIYRNDTPICRIRISKLGPRAVNKTSLTLQWVEERLPEVLLGGYHAPKHCRSRHKVAILIPYRDRFTNLVLFLHHMHPMWQKQLLEYRVFVIEQLGQYKFNKGALYNIAFIETQRFGAWDCYFFHDVDLIPLDERVLYTCPRNPTHMSPAVESNNFTLQYQTLFGGVTSMTPKHFLKVNGYSNYYWNWGAEDDDMYTRRKLTTGVLLLDNSALSYFLIGTYRVQAAKLIMVRLNMTIARYATLPHKPQRVNPDRYTKLGKARQRFRTEGLKTVEYRLISIRKNKLFTHTHCC